MTSNITGHDDELVVILYAQRLTAVQYSLLYIVGKKESAKKCKVIFTALHGMQTRSYDENSVRPSVCLSVCQTRAL